MDHTRAEHSIAAAGQGLAIAQQFELSFKQCQLLVAALLLHDIGHAWFSHRGEHLIAPYTGGHEQVGYKLVREDAEIRAVLEAFGLNVEEVIEIMAEKGPLGTIQSIADSLYLVLDSHALGYDDFGFDEARRLIHLGLRGIDNESLLVNDVALIRGFLNARRQRYIDSYLSLATRRRSAVLNALMEMVIGEIGIERYVREATLGRDQDLWSLVPRNRKAEVLTAFLNHHPVRVHTEIAKDGLPLIERPNTVAVLDRPHTGHFDKTLRVRVIDAHGGTELVSVKPTIPVPLELRLHYVHYIDL